MSWALGIDLGTSFTAAGLISGRRLETMALGAHSSAIPSAVFKGDESVTIGDAAMARGDVNPDRLVVEFKRQLGESSPILAGDQFVTAEELQALLGAWVFARACELEGSQPSQVVFTFPAFWGAFRRDSFLAIARQIVGDSDRVELLTEPEAAAAYYATRDRLPPGTIVGVYDLGGGTFDASILRKTETAFEVLGRPAGDDELGGVDLDNVLMRHVTERAGVNWEELNREDPRTTREMMQLRRNVIMAKEMLSEEMTTEIAVAIGSIVTTVQLTRRELEQLVEPLIARSLTVFETAIAYASVTPGDLHSILLVGAASRMPRIAEALTERFHVPLALDSHPKFAVCLGAAISSQQTDQAGVVAPLGPWAPPDVAGDEPQAAAATPAKRSGGARRPWWHFAAPAAVILIAVIAAIFLLGGGGPGGTVVMVQATEGFTDSGIVLAQGDIVTVDASGTIHHAPGPENTAGPDGVDVPAYTIYNVPDNGSVLDALHASLVAKVADGRPFEIGSHRTFTASAPGHLYFTVNDVGGTNNSGAFKARVQVKKP